MKHYQYFVSLENEYNIQDVKYHVIKDEISKWFNTRQEAITYARSIKNKLKNKLKFIKDNTITLDVNKYYISVDWQEDYLGVNYSLNIVGKY